MNTYVVIPAEVLTPADTYANLDTKGIQFLHPTIFTYNIFCT